MNNFFDKLKGDKKKSGDAPFKNPFANLGKGLGGQRKFEGGGQSLGGSRPGKVLHIRLEQPGPLGMKIEKRPGAEGTAIVAMVVEGSQAEAAGLQRGDILCHPNSNGDQEILHDMFVAMAASSERPLVFDVRRIQSKTTAPANTSSADAYSRKQAVIAAAEAREKAHKAKTKPISKVKEGSTLLQPKKPTPTNQTDVVTEPMTLEAKKAVMAAKQDESALAVQLGYNPYEASRATAGQALAATVTIAHGTLQHTSSGEPPRGQQSTGTAAATVPPPSLPMHFSEEYEDAMSIMMSTNEHGVVQSSLAIMRKLIVNAVTKGQSTDDEAAAAKVRKVRLSNPKIKAAITEVHGALEVMLSVGFQLAEEEGESFLVYPPGDRGPDWLPHALEQMQTV